MQENHLLTALPKLSPALTTWHWKNNKGWLLHQWRTQCCSFTNRWLVLFCLYMHELSLPWWVKVQHQQLIGIKFYRHCAVWCQYSTNYDADEKHALIICWSTNSMESQRDPSSLWIYIHHLEVNACVCAVSKYTTTRGRKKEKQWKPKEVQVNKNERGSHHLCSPLNQGPWKQHTLFKLFHPSLLEGPCTQVAKEGWHYTDTVCNRTGKLPRHLGRMPEHRFTFASLTWDFSNIEI